MQDTQSQNIPPEIYEAIQGEAPDFIVQSKIQFKARTPFILPFIFGLLWTTFVFYFISLSFKQIQEGAELTINNETIPLKLENWPQFIAPILIIIIFLAVGLGLIAIAIHFFRKKGSWYIGTPKRIIEYDKKIRKSVEWTKFTGKITYEDEPQKRSIFVKENMIFMIYLETKNDLPSIFYINGIPNLADIEQICRKRIEENT